MAGGTIHLLRAKTAAGLREATSEWSISSVPTPKGTVNAFAVAALIATLIALEQSVGQSTGRDTMKVEKKTGLKVKTGIKGGRLAANHNQHLALART